ncbi:MAG: signal peptidase I [Kiritimatiellia bacterium]|jgi:signal peptidase I
MNKHLREFLLPRPTRRFRVRLALVAAIAYGFFGHICLPMRLKGASMEPTYRDGGFVFCWRPAAWFQAPQRGDVVIIRFAGKRVALLKRVVGLAGDTIAFENGTLVRNGLSVAEPCIAGPCDWNLAPRTVAEGNIYVVGDNRAVDMDVHDFGEVGAHRILGKPLW